MTWSGEVSRYDRNPKRSELGHASFRLHMEGYSVRGPTGGKRESRIVIPYYHTTTTILPLPYYHTTSTILPFHHTTILPHHPRWSDLERRSTIRLKSGVPPPTDYFDQNGRKGFRSPRFENRKHIYINKIL